MTPWPAPEVRARVARPEEIPAAARRLAQAAAANGWAVMTHYARGTAPKSRSDWAPGAVVDSILVRCLRSGLLIAAYWEDGKSTGAWVATSGMGQRSVNVTQARAVIDT